MEKPHSLWISGLLAVAVAACSSPATPVALPVGVPGAGVTSGAAAAVSTPAGAGASSVSSALAENSGTHEDAQDYRVDGAAAASLTLRGDVIDVSGSGVTVTGSTATITAAGTYRLSGSLADGQIAVDTSDEAAVTLILDGVELHAASGAAINIVKAEKVILMLADGTQNVVTDGASYVFANADEAEPNAAIFSKADLTIFGGGALAVDGNFNDAIASKDGLIIAGGAITVKAADDGIRGKDYLVIEGGTLNVEAQGDGLKSDNEEDAAKGYVAVTAGSVTVTAGGDAIEAQTDVTIAEGAFMLTTGGGSAGQVAADASAKAIKAGVNLNIDGGTFTINSADDALHSNGTISINGGAFSLASGDDAVHAESALTVNAGTFQITESYEGLESMAITLNGGTFHVVASDDGLNIAGGIDGSGLGGPPGGGRRGPGGFGQPDAAAYTGSYRLSINGGYIEVKAAGDGLDVNGAVEMTGGVLLVNGPTEQMNGALDYDAGFNLSGGLLVAAGSAGMAQAPGAASTQNSVLIYFGSTVPAGTLVRIQSSDGREVLTFAPVKEFQSLVFSSPELVAGATYTVLLGGSSAGAAADGLYQEGAYTPGTEFASFAVSGPVTTVGTGGGRPGRP